MYETHCSEHIANLNIFTSQCIFIRWNATLAKYTVQCTILPPWPQVVDWCCLRPIDWTVYSLERELYSE